ncbi:MAG: rhomboid family intramembrane serine protease [Bacteroidetes bacterium 46-16]|nr:MAG: rhomboid family intramembrane serine protease [Bacteroidetes bacterium 46-16]
MSVTLIIIAVTAIVSIMAFNNELLFNKLILWPKRMNSPEEYYRLLTSGFIHADWGHLFFNMLTLYFFGYGQGYGVEAIFQSLGKGFAYPILYLFAIIVASIPSFIKNRNNGYYRSLGASGGVAAILFSSVYFSPWNKIYLMFIPIGIPAILFAGLYLVYCVYMDRRGGSNINHGAHFWGSVFGFVFTFILDPTHGQIFIQQIIPQ